MLFRYLTLGIACGDPGFALATPREKEEGCVFFFPPTHPPREMDGRMWRSRVSHGRFLEEGESVPPSRIYSPTLDQ